MLDIFVSLAMWLGRRKLRKELVVTGKPDGSSTAVMLYSAASAAAALMLRVKRVRASFTVCGLKVALRASFVEMSASGRLPSSTRLNNGSRPSESLNSSLLFSAVIVQPWSGAWHVAHER